MVQQEGLYCEEALGQVSRIFAIGVASPVLEHLQLLCVSIPSCAYSRDTTLADTTDEQA